MPRRRGRRRNQYLRYLNDPEIPIPRSTVKYRNIRQARLLENDVPICQMNEQEENLMELSESENASPSNSDGGSEDHDNQHLQTNDDQEKSELNVLCNPVENYQNDDENSNLHVQYRNVENDYDDDMELDVQNCDSKNDSDDDIPLNIQSRTVGDDHNNDEWSDSSNKSITEYGNDNESIYSDSTTSESITDDHSVSNGEESDCDPFYNHETSDSEDENLSENKDIWDQTPHRSYSEIIRENKDFESYYQVQEIVLNHEWDSFIKIMREDLPTAFRITGSKTETKTLLRIIKGDFFKEILNTDCNNEVSNVNLDIKPHCLPFYPEELGWQLQISRKDIRRSEIFFKLHNFLIAETDGGNISRQEVVSMVPPLVLDVKPSHKVLDMCAAPGSKTAQLIEMIHTDEKIPIPEGFVIANDLDNNRCYMLVHQAKRLNSPNILITNHDASVMPNFTTKFNGRTEILKFDRILADVPCSGDGTMRKNPDIWCKWNPANGNNLHGIQYRIAKRGVEQLAIGGKMVYSTCSLNPIENEAVLHRLLSEAGDSIELVDCKDLVPGLIYNPGLSNWLPASKNLQYFHRWEDVPEELRTQIRPKMFPPANEESAKYHFERCMRILPHHQNTGGFFVAVLRKLKLLPWENELQNKISKNEQRDLLETKEKENDLKKVGEKRDFENTQKVCEPQRKRKRIPGYREDPFIFFKDTNEDVWPSIREFYNISDELHPQCLLVRCREGKRKNIYFTSPQIRDIIINNEDKVKMINTGVKTFVRCDNKNMECAFRLAQEGLKSIINYIGERRKIQISKEDLILLLQNTDHRYPPEITKLTVETQKKLKFLAPGSCILIYEENNSEKIYPLKFEIVGWRGTISLRAYVSICDTIHYLRLLEEDFSMFEKNKFQSNRNEESKKLEENMLH